MLTQNWPEDKHPSTAMRILTYLLPGFYVFLTDEAESDGYLPRPLVTLLMNGDLNKEKDEGWHQFAPSELALDR